MLLLKKREEIFSDTSICSGSMPEYRNQLFHFKANCPFIVFLEPMISLNQESGT